MNGKGSRPAESRIPVMSPSPLRRAGSLRLGTCPPIQEHRTDQLTRSKLIRHRSLQSLNTASSLGYGYEQDDDADSVKSYGSTASACSNVSQCDHAHFARNGTTYSGRCKRYVVHCSPHSADTDDYLTPTQRTNRTIRKLRNLLKEAQVELAEKDKEILRLTKEVVELRLLKADLDPVSESNDIDGQSKLDQLQDENKSTRSEQITRSPLSRYCSSPPLAQSLSDSGHFEDLNSSKDILQNGQSQSKTLESLQRRFDDEIRELKERHNDKVESLLQKITDVNERYYTLKPLYEECKEKLHELEKLNGDLKNGPCRTCLTLQSGETSINKDALLVELDELKLKHDKLKIENVQLKNKVDELMLEVSALKDTNNKISFGRNSLSADETVQTDDVKNLCNGSHSGDGHVFTKCFDQNHQCSYKLENSELKSQILAHVEKIKQLEEQENNDKDIYVQLYKKGIQAAKLLDEKDPESLQNPDADGTTLIPNLLNKLRIKQEELDNVKDKDYKSADNLLSAKEAVSLWQLSRKAMYRRLLETKKEQPKHDPEMTLQFLKSAFYYFLTDRENAQGHLSAIESILGFTDSEKTNIERAFLWR